MPSIIESIDIEQLLAYEGFEYKMSSGNSGLQINVRECPKCGRVDWKVYFNAETGLGNCFGCSTGFNKAKFIKIHKGYTSLGPMYRYLDSISTTLVSKPKLSPANYKLNLDWKLPLNKRILLDEDIPQYLKDRNITGKLAKRFDLRLCENGFYRYTDWHDKVKNVDFSNRVIIPVYDIDGELATFQGRDITGKSEKKYLFPNMLPGTARYIYNAHYIIKNRYKKVILNEGAFDVFATTEALESDIAYSNYAAAGTFGKHLSISNGGVIAADQLADLIKMRQAGVEELTLMWDGEFKALVAAYEAAVKLQTYGFTTRVAHLPKDCDPAEVTKEQILKAIDEAKKPTALTLAMFRINA